MVGTNPSTQGTREIFGWAVLTNVDGTPTTFFITKNQALFIEASATFNLMKVF
jgi:hypothetical protein